MARTYESLTKEERDNLQELFETYKILDFVACGPFGKRYPVLKEVAKDADDKFVSEVERVLGTEFSYQDFRKYFFTTED